MTPPGPFEEATPLALPATSGEVVGSHSGSYLGATIRETTGTTAARVTLYDNASAATGSIVDELEVDAGKSNESNFPRPGRLVQNGLYAQITGSIEGSVFQ